MSLLYVESAIAHTRFELAPIREPNYIAERRAKGDPTMPNPVAVNLGSIFGVRDAADPPDCWRYGLFRYMKHWSEDEAEAFRAMCIAKGWQIVRF